MATAKKAAPAKKVAAKKAPAKKAAAKKTHSGRGLAQDRRQVSAETPHEVAYEAKKMGVTQAAVKAAIKKVGNDRAKIEAELTKVAAKKGHTARGLAQDRRQVSGEAKYEVAYVAKKMGVTQAAVMTAIKKVGNDRATIEAELKKRK
jgi:predicted transcriptional regulator